MARQYLHPGEKNRRITIEQRTTSRSASGQPVESWSTYRTVWAQRDQELGDEDFDNDKLVSRSEVTFRIDYISGLDPANYRIAHDGEKYEIESIREMGYKRALELKTYVDR